MTHRAEERMPEWPEPPTDEYELVSGWHVAKYERARADAAMARLRVAVEGLRKLRECSIEETLDDIAEEYLAAIGPLPLPAAGERG